MSIHRFVLSPWRSLLVALMVALVSLFAFGCGSSNDGYASTGNNSPTAPSAPQVMPPLPPSPPATTGSVTFELAKVKAQTIVPAATQSLVFEFFDANGDSVLPAVTLPFSTTVTIDGVPSTATSAHITAIDGQGNPLSTTSATFVVVPGANTNASIATPVEVTFVVDVTPNATVDVTVEAEDGTLVADPLTVTLTNDTPSLPVTTTFNGKSVAATGELSGFSGAVNLNNLSVSSGVVGSSANVNGGAVLTLKYTPAGGAEHTTNLPIIVNRGVVFGGGGTVVSPARLVLDQKKLWIVTTAATGSLNGNYFPTGSSVGIARKGVEAGTFSATVLSTVPANTAGHWSFDSNSGTIKAQGIDGDPSADDSVTYKVSFTPSGQAPVSDTVTVTVTGDTTLPGKVQSAKVIPYPGILRLPLGATFPVFIKMILNNGTMTYVQPTRFVDSTGTPSGADAAGVITLTSDDPAIRYNMPAPIFPPGTLDFHSVGGANITITRNTSGGAGGPSDLGGGRAEAVPLSLLTPTPPATKNVFLTFAKSSTEVGGFLPYQVTLKLNDGTSTDLTPIAKLRVPFGPPLGGDPIFQLLDFGNAPTGLIQVVKAGGGPAELDNVGHFGANLRDNQLGLLLDTSPQPITTIP